jgi:hypothetical protein
LAAELRIAFLVFLFLSAFLLLIRTKGAVLGGLNLLDVLLDFVIVLVVSGTVLTFSFLLFRIDPMPLIRNLTYQLSLKQLVSFEYAIPSSLKNSLAVSEVMRQDTDGDNFDEWVVFYKFDVKEKDSPIKAVIYDSDRGNPPVIFPYELRVPGRDYLAEDGTEKPSFTLEQVTRDQNGPSNNADLPEILINSKNELSIFRYRNNSEPWDFPRDVPPRYEAIGFFRGSGGVTYDDQTRRVTVIDRNGFERSQLAVRSIYVVNETNTFWDAETYWDNLHGGLQRDLDAKLAAPAFATIDFFPEPPNDIEQSAFPEKIVLAFYASTCSGENTSLCRNAAAQWNTQNFLAPNSEALAEYENGNPVYFGLSGDNFKGTSQLAVTRLCYYPTLETDPDLRETGPGRDVVTGEQARFNLVDLEFVVNSLPPDTARYEMALDNGQWKMVRRVQLNSSQVCTDSPVQLSASPQ